jgi:aerobic carbon-monoxide dehydrogenase large subunit
VDDLRPTGTGTGEPVRRKEDFRLLTGKGVFSDDVNLPGQAHALMVRSWHPHARIASIDTRAAKSVPGVLAVVTGADLLAGGVNSIPIQAVNNPPPDLALKNPDGSPGRVAPRYVLPVDKVRYLGEAIAMVVAETVAAARDAVDLVQVDYETLPAVMRAEAALKDGALTVCESIVGNLGLDAEVGDAAATEAGFRRAAHIVRLETWVQRVAAVPMEPRASLGDYDRATERFTLYAGSPGPARNRHELAAVLGVPAEKVRIVARDIGGSFGGRAYFHPEYALVCWASRHVGRPVKWRCERQESFLVDNQARDLAVSAELALDADGNFLALRGTNLNNLGAYALTYVPLMKGVELMSSVYRIGAAHFRARAALSNVAPLAVYRSAGRPEAMFVMERLIDLAARQCGFDRVELRRRNLIPPASLPFTNPVGLTYDNGTYEAVMEQSLGLADWQGFPARRAEAAKRGKYRGIGVANYIECTTGVPHERAEIRVLPEGKVMVLIGTQSTGQGHETSFAQPLTDWLGVPFESVEIVTGDTDRVPVGGGSNSGRSMRFAGVLMGRASQDIVAKGVKIAAHVLEAAEEDIEFTAGRFHVKGTDRMLGIFETAAAARDLASLPDALRGPLSSAHEEFFRVGGFPYGSHVCEVEVDVETGAVQIVGYAAVDDVGRAVNPMILHGQTHGGVAQGVGQALLEAIHYDPESGQLLSGSFMDYAMPRADSLPSFESAISEVPSPTNPLGIRAGGEGGTTPALAVVINAIVDALADFGVTHIEMPATPERVWRAIRTASATRSQSN